MQASNNLSILNRVFIFFINIIIAFIIFGITAEQFIPTGGLESVWLFSAIALWFLSLVSSPWFQAPRDSLANSTAALLILVTIDLNVVPLYSTELELIKCVFITYCALISVFSLLALYCHDAFPLAPKSKLIFRMVNALGSAEILYTPSALISIIGFYQFDFSVMSWLIISWVIFVLLKPVELIFLIFKQWHFENKDQDVALTGNMIRVDYPNIIRILLAKQANWVARNVHIVHLPDGNQEYVMTLYSQMQESGITGTGLLMGRVDDVKKDNSMQIGQVKRCPDPEKINELIESLSGAKNCALVGFSVEDSTIGTLQFEVACEEVLKEGDVIFARVNKEDIFYQILDAETAEENFDNNPKGTHIVRAAQLGIYTANKGFTKYQWLPPMNSPLFSAKSKKFEEQNLSERDFFLAKIPSTDIEMAVNIDDLVEYHTAILGATGTGKTELALDIIRQGAQKEIKVFCVDFTGDYKHRLRDLEPEFPKLAEEDAAELEQKLFDVETGTYGASQEKKILKVTIDEFRVQIKDQVKTFLEGDKKVAILELAEIANTKASLRLTEIYLSTIMNWAKNNRNQHKIMLALEEAHTIIPETRGSGFDFDSQWVVSRIGQIALQGRKYGVGLMVISQRTALVSKTILSQCNTFFTHSLIDQTSLNFLENVYSRQHSKLIPNLPNLHFLAQGKALRTERPVFLAKDFDQDKFDASKNIPSPEISEDIEDTVEIESPDDSGQGGPRAWSPDA